MTIQQVVERYGIDRSTVNKAIRKGKIAHVKEGRTLWVMAWRAAELWEYRVLEAQGLRRCVECLEVKAIEEFPCGKKGSHRSTCRECWRPIATKWMSQYRKRPAVQKRMRAWYEARGGVAEYRKRQRLNRRMKKNILQDERG